MPKLASPIANPSALPGTRHAPDYSIEELDALGRVRAGDQFTWRGDHYLATADARDEIRDGFRRLFIEACQRNGAMASGWALADIVASRRVSSLEDIAAIEPDAPSVKRMSGDRQDAFIRAWKRKGKPFAFVAVLDREKVAEWALGVATANESGYAPVPAAWAHGSDHGAFSDYVDELNAAAGIDRETAFAIVASSMGGKRYVAPDAIEPDADEWEERPAGLTEEDSSVRITFKRTGDSVILSDTGNGGAAAYDVLREAPGTPDGWESILPDTVTMGTLATCRIIAHAYLSGRARAIAEATAPDAIEPDAPRYEVTGLDCSADGMERLRDGDEFILLAYPGPYSSPEEIGRNWADDINACARPDGFDYDAAREAVRTWAADNSDAIARQHAAFVDEWEGDDGFNETPTFRLYVRDNQEEESNK